jgi:hypothetical protein
MISLIYNFPSRRRWRLPSVNNCFSHSGSTAKQKSSTWQNNSSRLMLGTPLGFGQPEGYSFIERCPTLSITDVDLRNYRLRIESFNSQLVNMGIQRLHARTRAGFDLKIQASLFALTFQHFN